jgi:hypothetical protein
MGNMALSKPENIKLADVQVDILACITEWLDGVSIGRLWFTGASKLHYTMVHGGVRRFDVDLGRRRTKYVFPSLVTQFQSLEQFNISQPHEKNYHPYLTIPIASLPRSLRALGIFCPINLRSFAKEPMGRFQYIPLATVLPNLQKLSISSYISLYPEFAREMTNILELKICTSIWSVRDFWSELPKTLDVIDIGKERDDDTPAEGCFPFELPSKPSRAVWYQSWELIHHLPQSLTSLKLLEPYSGELKWSTSKLWNTLPPGLTELSIPISPNSGGQEMKEEEFTGHMKRLPPSLLHLEISELGWVGTPFSSSSLAALPQGLKTLALKGFSVSTEDFAILPRSLTSFACHQPLGFILAHLSLFPKSIASISFTGASLETTELGFGSMKDYEAMEKPPKPFPPHLSSLSVESMDYELIPLLPPSLTDLKVENFAKRKTDSIEPDEIQKMHFHPNSQLLMFCTTCINPLPLVMLLPNNLRTLNLDIPRHSLYFGKPFFGLQDFPWDWTKHLPRNLSCLRLTLANFGFGGDLMMQNLPQQLESLEIKSVGDSPVDPKLMFTSFDVFPKSLINLDVNIAASFEDMKIFQVLPPHLEVLSIKSTTLPIPFDRTTIDQLPATLAKLAIPWISIETHERFTSFCLANFGIHLEWHHTRRLRRVIS